MPQSTTAVCWLGPWCLHRPPFSKRWPRWSIIAIHSQFPFCYPISVCLGPVLSVCCHLFPLCFLHPPGGTVQLHSDLHQPSAAVYFCFLLSGGTWHTHTHAHTHTFTHKLLFLKCDPARWRPPESFTCTTYNSRDATPQGREKTPGSPVAANW